MVWQHYHHQTLAMLEEGIDRLTFVYISVYIEEIKVEAWTSATFIMYS